MRALRGCTRTDLPPVEWDVDPVRLLAHMGRSIDTDNPVLSVRRRDGGVQPVDPDHPPEDASEGCPGGWYRTEFASSLIRYLRSRSEGGVRNQNHFLDASDDPLVLECVYYYEREQERVFARRSEMAAEQRAKG